MKMDFYSIKLLIILVWSFRNVFSKEIVPIVETHSGPVRGFYQVSLNNRTYKAFDGIPYAKPPVGDLRFRSPVPIEPWTDVLDATKEITTCAQLGSRLGELQGQEDCLYLNVYTPHTGKGPLFPVIFFIHGGAFQRQTSKNYGPKYFMSKDLVYVNFNYRLGPFGFLSTGDASLPGNFGLRDQNLALKWVVKNIERFGGDPKKITLQGCSAGGASVHFHYLSPMSRGLFQNGISMSGNALVPWVIEKNPMNGTMTMAKFVNCTTTDSMDMVECLRRIPAEDLALAAGKLLLLKNLFIDVDRSPFQPVIERSKDDYFMNRDPKDIIEYHDAYDVPWIVGVASEDGIIFTQGMLENQTKLDYVDKYWIEIVPYMMFIEDLPKNKQEKVVKAARKHYLGDKPLKVEDYSTSMQLLHLLGDKNTLFETERVAVMQAKANKSPVHLYYYSYTAQSIPAFGNRKFGCYHCDDETLMIDRTDPTENAMDMRMQAILMNMSYSFAMEGKPDLGVVGVKWPVVKKSSTKVLEYLHVNGPDSLVTKTRDNFAEKKFWNKMGF